MYFSTDRKDHIFENLADILESIGVYLTSLFLSIVTSRTQGDVLIEMLLLYVLLSTF